MAKRNGNGEGSIYQRKDGRWEACAYQKTVSGQTKRFRVVSTGRATARRKLVERLAEAQKGILMADKSWTVSDYLDYWMTEVVAHKNRPRTIELYEMAVRVHLKPHIGTTHLRDLSVRQFQAVINHMQAEGKSSRTIQLSRSVLRAALNRAIREELIPRNVASLVDMPRWERKEISTWGPEQVTQFLETAKDSPWFGAYLILCVYGMRRGEVLGLRWRDVDFDKNRLHVRQQLQRVSGVLTQGPVKTAAGRRDLPLIAPVWAALAKAAQRAGFDPEAGTVAPDGPLANTLVFTSQAGTPIDPKNFVRTFHQIREDAGLPWITVHHIRHSAATLLKNLGVPARDAQLILGHSNVTTTQQLYQHADIEGQKIALEEVGRSLVFGDDGNGSRQNYPSKMNSVGENLRFTPGGPGGTRTLDTLLKSLMFLISTPSATPVIGALSTRISTQILGAVAVKTSHQRVGPLTPCMLGRWEQLTALRHGLRNAVNQLRNPWPDTQPVPSPTGPTVANHPLKIEEKRP
ncbi:tyrosine-type recombinase/integrase [Arthrobacter sp. UYCu723]